MDKIEIEPTNHLPKVVMDPEKGYILFEGRAIVPNAVEFFEPLIGWVKEFTKDLTKKLVFDCKLDYYNTASSKMILQFFLTLKEAEDNGFITEINWYHHPDDEDMVESAEETEILSQLKFNYKELD